MKIKVKGLLTLIAAGLIVQSGFIYVATDRTAPTIKFGDTLPVYKGNPSDKELLSNVTARDGRDGDVSSSLYVDTVRVTSDGSHATVTYVAMDKHNNVAKASQQITSQASAKAEPTNEAPKITMSAAKATIGVYDDFSMLDYVASITDDTDDSTYLKAHLLVDGTPNENAAGTYQLSCYVYDSQGSKSNVEKFTLTRQ